MRTQLEQIAREAGSLAYQYFRQSATLQVENKHSLDLVTQADKAVENFVKNKLSLLYPEDGFYGEESDNAEPLPTNDRIWVIDPIDGTFNFVRGSKDWAISIGLYERINGLKRATFGVVYAPAADTIISGGGAMDVKLNGCNVTTKQPFLSDRGCVGIGYNPTYPQETVLELTRYLLDSAGVTFRHVGSACISMLRVLQNYTDAYVGLGDSSWDIMASIAILEKLGYLNTLDWDTFTLDQKQVFTVGKPEVVSMLEAHNDSSCLKI
ncbi:MAG: inositol monophosphatase [Marinomonas sp.]